MNDEHLVTVATGLIQWCNHLIDRGETLSVPEAREAAVGLAIRSRLRAFQNAELDPTLSSDSFDDAWAEIEEQFSQHAQRDPASKWGITNNGLCLISDFATEVIRGV